MKKILLLAGLAVSLCSFSSQAQVHVNVQIGAPVAQQPWYGYDDDYYYMPEQGVYYNVARGMYVYPEGGGWASGSCLPQRYGGYTWGNSHYYRVHERAPFMRNDYYRRQYPVAYNNGGGYRGGEQRGFERRNESYNGNGGWRGGDRGGYNNDNRGDHNQHNNNGGGYGGGSTHYNRR